MERRSILRAGLSGLLGFFAIRQTAAAAPPKRQRVAYHLADLDRVVFALGNIQNHVDGVGGPGQADIRLVVHGPALRGFHALAAQPHIVAATERLTQAGVAFEACANTMKAQGVKLEDLTSGFIAAEKGGVVRLAELQQQGYAYLRP
ncbi:MAG: DsrE family protein [Bradyrhizobium sp.]|uniref:DsrE family protein n=1 Tax=Bradyrhizobium sp. TaxID=376 RepID=UPI0025B8E6B1|nr:DsrE family protein [Bradyrhizobium sp.]MBI5261769.1 DsrE family protein [Bradyrhizobium sp.]